MAMAKKPVSKTSPAKIAPAPKKPASKAPAMPKGEKPAVGTDKAAKKKYGESSWNNGYTN